MYRHTYVIEKICLNFFQNIICILHQLLEYEYKLVFLPKKHLFFVYFFIIFDNFYREEQQVNKQFVLPT